MIAGDKGIWVPEGVPHEVIASTEVQMRNLQISRTLAPELPTSVCPMTVSPLFNELLRSAVEGKQWFASGSREAKVLDLLVLEFHPAADLVFSVPEPKDARLRRICAAIQKNPSDNKSLAEWADTAGGVRGPSNVCSARKPALRSRNGDARLGYRTPSSVFISVNP